MGLFHGVSVRTSLYFLKDDKMVDYISDESSIATFRERVQRMIGSVCAKEFVAKPLFVGCQRCDCRDLCDVGERGEE